MTWSDAPNHNIIEIPKVRPSLDGRLECQVLTTFTGCQLPMRKPGFPE
jgi:hypothetical protein